MNPSTEKSPKQDHSFDTESLGHRLPFPLRLSQSAAFQKEVLLPEQRTAIHSGKLGDIIYALPACRALGVNHLVVNACQSATDPLKNFPTAAAVQLVPLLLFQKYLTRVSVSELGHSLEDAPPLKEIDYNFDFFRKVPRHRVGKMILDMEPFVNINFKDVPAHLGEHFASAVGISAELKEPWLTAPKSPLTRNAVVISITRNWRSFSDRYWQLLLEGLPEVVFVGHPKEFSQVAIPQAKFVGTDNHLELAALINGARLFLGTVSFPYALAEGLKVPRMVEICLDNMNVFPVGPQGEVLSPDVVNSRTRIARTLRLSPDSEYVKTTQRLRRRPSIFAYSLRQRLNFITRYPNETRKQTLRRLLTFWKR